MIKPQVCKIDREQNPDHQQFHYFLPVFPTKLAPANIKVKGCYFYIGLGE
jgi:hypothetical protein